MSVQSNPPVEVEACVGLANLADPQVRANARRAIAGRCAWEQVAAEIGVTADELHRCLGPRRSWWGRS